MVSRTALALLVASLLVSTVPACRARPDTYAYAPKRDGTITRYRVDGRTGNLNPLPGVTDTVDAKRLPQLVLSSDRRFLYAYRMFDRQLDGYDMEEFDNSRKDAAQVKPTAITVFAIKTDGALRRVGSVVVPGPVGQLAPRPGERFVHALTVGGGFLLKVARDGRLIYAGRVAIESGMGLYAAAGERDVWKLTFAPSGAFLYDFRGDGFVDHAENYLHRYRVSAFTGKPTPDGKVWIGNRWRAWEEKIGRVSDDSGEVHCFVNKTAFVNGFENGFWVCRVDDAGRIVSRGSRLALTPTGKGENNFVPRLAKHPTLPLVVYGNGGTSEPRTIWRVVAPGKIAKVGAFPPALTESAALSLYIEPAGRFLYEMTGSDENGKSGRVAIFALDKTATRAKLSVPPFPFPSDNRAGFVFVTAPAK